VSWEGHNAQNPRKMQRVLLAFPHFEIKSLKLGKQALKHDRCPIPHFPLSEIGQRTSNGQLPSPPFSWFRCWELLDLPQEKKRENRGLERRKMVLETKRSYEECRRQRLQENKRRLEELNLGKLAQALKASSPKSSPVGLITPSVCFLGFEV
jgi:hypothetical protein